MVTRAAAKGAVEAQDELVDPKTGEVTTASAGGAVVANGAYDYGDDVGAGYENQTNEDVAIPFLVVLQPGSPEVQGEDAVGRAGMIINKTTNEMFSGREGVDFIPAVTQHVLVEWVPRDKGGGLVATHDLASELAVKVRRDQPLGQYKHPDNGNDLVETFYVYGVGLTPEGNPYPAVVAFSSTHITPYKDWMFKARSIVIALPDGRKVTKLPLFSHCYSIKTLKKEKNGNTWFVPVVGFSDENAEKSRLAPTSDLYRVAKGVHEAFAAGAIKADTGSLKNDRVDPQPRRGDTSAEDAPY